MLLNANYFFILKQAKDKGPKALYEGYVSTIKETDNLVCEKSIHYLKNFVQFPGDLCEGIIRASKNEYLTLDVWGGEYLRLLTIIAAYHLDRNEILTGLFWAKKAIDLLGYFNPTIKLDTEREIVRNMPASSMLCCFPNRFNEAAYDNFFLEWEIKRFYYCGNISHFNDN